MQEAKINAHLRTTLREKDLVRPNSFQSTNRSDKALWLDKNENVDPEYLAVIQKIINSVSIKDLSCYPDLAILYQKLANYLKVSVNYLLVSHGSDGIIHAVFDTFMNPGDKIILTSPTFAMYDVYSKLYGAEMVSVTYQPSEEGPFILSETLIDTILEHKPKMVCLPNPDSPTGTFFKQSELCEIIEAANNVNSIVLLDEAYYPFHPETMLPYIERFNNLIITRTFSKAWGLAGIRVGYAISNYNLNQYLHKVKPMYEIGALSCMLAADALEFHDEMLMSVARLEAGKKYFLNEMSALGFKTFKNTAGNFLHVGFGQKSEKIHEALQADVLYRKDFSQPCLAGYSRFSSTTKENFQPLVNLIKNIV